MTAYYSDAQVAARIESYLESAPSDHMLGLQVRVLFELRAEELQRHGVTELPEDGEDRVFDVLPPREGWGGVAVVLTREGPEPTIMVEINSRALTVAEAERLYAVLGRALEAVRS